MNKPTGYDEIDAKIFNAERPIGVFECKIVDAIETTSKKSGSEMLVLDLEIVKGEFTGYFERVQREDKPWPFKLYSVNTEDNAPYFKGHIKAIEESNPSYTWDWVPSSLVGKLIGVNIREEEYIGQDGNVHSSLKPAYIFPLKDIAKQKPLKKKTIATEAPAATNTQSPDNLPF